MIDFLGNPNEPEAEVLQHIYFVEWYFPFYLPVVVLLKFFPILWLLIYRQKKQRYNLFSWKSPGT